MTARRLAARSVPGRALSWRPLVTGVLALFLVVGLAWSVASLRQQADRHWERASTLSATDTLAGAEVAAAWHCAAARTDLCPGEVDAAARDLDAQVRALTKDGVTGLSGPLKSHNAAVASARAGFAAPRAADRGAAAMQVAAAEPELVKTLDQAAFDQRRLEHSADRVADLVSLLLLLFAAVIVGLVVRRFSAIRVEGEESAATERARGEARFRSLVTNASDVVTLTDADGVILFQTPSVQRVLGYEPDAGIGHAALEWCHPDDQDLLRAAFLRTLAGEDYVTTIARWRHADGTWRWLESVRTNLLADPDVAAVVINSRDVTEQRELAGQLAHNVLHDVLTGLPNRALFVDRLEQAIRRGL